MIDSLRPLVAVLLPLVAVLPILLSGRRPNVREGWTLLAGVATFAVVASMAPGVLAGTVYATAFGAVFPGVAVSLRVDPLGLLFGLLASGLWVVTSVYNVGYMRGLDEHDQTRYYAAFAASIGAALGVAFASNLLVLFVFYELLTVATYPLVAHDRTEEARRAGRMYLAYAFSGGVAVLAGSVLVLWLAGSVSFTAGGIPALLESDPVAARAAFALLVGGFAVKAAMVPLHSWLPEAMVAPTPVSGLLHAVAVVKSGVFGIARVVLDVYGPPGVETLGVGLPLAAVAAATIVVASVIALRQDELKRLLAYSTISQLSYIVLGLAVLHPTAMVGGLFHIPAHAFMKLTLFFCVGALYVETGIKRVSDLGGIGWRMPLTMGAFAVAALGMAGLPLVAGFVSKWHLLIGSVDAGRQVFAAALLLSGVLNVAYFWPVVYRAFFVPADGQPAGDEAGAEAGVGAAPGGGPASPLGGSDDESPVLRDGGLDTGEGLTPASWLLVGPILATVTGAVVLGLVPEAATFLRLADQIVATGLEVAP